MGNGSMKKEKVVVGMSGGVDSSVAAFLLKKEGYEVIGVTLNLWNGEGMSVAEPGEEAGGITDARRAAEQLGIEYHVLDFTEQFRYCVIEPFIGEYEACRTPNPCITCNRRIKWEALLSWAKEHGVEKIATGHYAGIVQLDNGRYTIMEAASTGKDQSYVLYRLTQEQLASTLMPLGKYTKEEVRKLAKEAGLFVAEKDDSQDICFIPDGDYASFIERYGAKCDSNSPGNFVDRDGNILGKHKGLIHYTIGQRKGLGLAMGEPVYVMALRPTTNEVVIGKNEDLFDRRLTLSEVNCVGLAQWKEPFRCMAKIRYAHKGAECLVTPTGTDTASVLFDEPQRAATPGQSVVFYQTKAHMRYVLGGGIIV